MQTMNETPSQWLIDQFEETLREYRSGEIHWSELGLGEVQDMILLKDDLELHSYPRCSTCGWTGEGEEPKIFFRGPIFPVYGPTGTLRAFSVMSGRYLQAGLPPV
jgi:hypothetical protein